MDVEARSRSPIVASCFVLGAVGLAYLLFKCLSLYGEPGFDFSYLWTAGRVWAEGGSTNDAAFHAMAARHVPNGAVPEVWSYPPNWWAVCVALGSTSLSKANLIWNIVSIGLIAGASILLAKSVRPAFGEVRTGVAALDEIVRRPWALASLHFFLMAAFEATATLISIGQTTAPIYFGVAALLFGLVTGSRGWALAGLVLTFLKPQIGVVFAAVMLFQGKQGRAILLRAVGVSAFLAAPAFIADPGILGGFLRNAAGHEGIMPSNEPGAMTGIRLLSGLTGFALSTFASLFATILAALAACAGQARLNISGSARVQAWQTICLTTAIIVAVAPLHYYDLILAGVTVFVVAVAPGALRLAGIVGLLMMFRADMIGGALGLYDRSVPIFEGSILSTIGAFMVLAAACGAAIRWEQSRGIAAWSIAEASSSGAARS